MGSDAQGGDDEGGGSHVAGRKCVPPAINCEPRLNSWRRTRGAGSALSVSPVLANVATPFHVPLLLPLSPVGL